MDTSLFIAKTHDFDHSEMLDCRNYLNSDELAAYNKIKMNQDKKIYIVSRKILKSALQKCYPDINIKNWRFTKNRYGKPLIIYPKLQNPLYFNISHSLDAIAVAISQKSDVGVDIEKIRNLELTSFPESSISHLEISKKYFTNSEYKKIERLPYSDGVTHFWRLWTLKESYMKYRGIGLSLGLNCIEVDISNQSIIIKPNDVDTNVYQWFKEDMVISLSLSKKHHSITLFDYDTSIASPTGNNYQYIHN